ncbi:site-specific integrase [Priestia aryabhattai]|uniref:site-specific integrase n=1 Tax=Priestia aryabhattai TaxID=412384 RepID=UPI002E1A235A|nr:site-specific integrase [Priestia aryabhattai]
MQGYFRKRGSTWSFTIDIGIDPKTGKRKQKTCSGFRTKKDAQLEAAKLQQELSQGTFISEKDTKFKDFVKEWLREYENTVKVSTVRVREHESGRLLSYFGGLKLKQITKKMYQDLLYDLFEKGYALNTISGIHSTGRMIFKKAIELELIKNDPTQYAKIPRAIKTVEEIESEKEIVKYLEKEELALFLTTAKKQGLDRDYEIFLTLAYSGVRVGELCALMWKDISFNDHTVTITKTYYNPRNIVRDYQILPPKTRNSKRIIDLDPAVLKELEKLKIRQSEIKMLNRNTYYDEGFVFAKTGKYLGYPEFIKTIQNRMTRLLKLSGLNYKLTPHSLRHTHTSLLAEAGVGIHEIMERLGHVEDDITKRVYLHVTKAMKTEASKKFGELMRYL